MPTLTTPSHLARTDAAADTVPGILCGAGHFNHSRWRHCRTCGSVLLARGELRTRGPRPIVGMLLRNDGLKIAISAPLVIVVRETTQAPTCVPWNDRGRSIARIGVQFLDWQPLLKAESGVCRLRRGGVTVPLTPGVPAPLHGGWSIHLGRGSFLYESLVPGEQALEPTGTDPVGALTRGRHRARRSRLPDPSIFPRRSTP